MRIILLLSLLGLTSCFNFLELDQDIKEEVVSLIPSIKNVKLYPSDNLYSSFTIKGEVQDINEISIYTDVDCTVLYDTITDSEFEVGKSFSTSVQNITNFYYLLNNNCNHIGKYKSIPSSDFHLILDTTVSSSITHANGRVQGINDLSLKGNHLTQSESVRYPVYREENGLDILRADVSLNNYLTLKNTDLNTDSLVTGLDQVTIHVVAKIFDHNPSIGQNPVITFLPSSTSGVFIGGNARPRPIFGLLGGYQESNVDVEDYEWHLFTFIKDYTQLKVYMDGMEIDSSIENDSFNIEELHLFNLFGAQAFHGDFSQASIIYNHVQSQGEIKSHMNMICGKSSEFSHICKRDSLVAFFTNSLGFTNNVGIGNTIMNKLLSDGNHVNTWYNYAVGGVTTVDLNDVHGQHIDTLVDKSDNSIIIVWEGINEMRTGSTVQEAFDALETLCLARKEAGWSKVVVMTLLPGSSTNDHIEAQGGYEVMRTQYNDLLRQNYSDFADLLVDLDINETGIGSDIYDAWVNQDNTIWLDGNWSHLVNDGNTLLVDIIDNYLSSIFN